MTCRPHEVQKVRNSGFFTKIIISQQSFLEVQNAFGVYIYTTLEPPRMTSDRKKWFLHFLQLFTTFSLLARMYYRGNGILGIFQPRWAFFVKCALFEKFPKESAPPIWRIYIRHWKVSGGTISRKFRFCEKVQPGPPKVPINDRFYNTFLQVAEKYIFCNLLVFHEMY